MKPRHLGTAAFLFVLLILSGCVHQRYLGSTDGEFRYVGLRVKVARVEDGTLAVKIANTADSERSILLRPVSAAIGIKSGERILAAYRTEPRRIILAPGEQALTAIHMRNWYRATKEFNSRLDLYVSVGDRREQVRIPLDQNDFFEDPERTFSENRQGLNLPAISGSLRIRFDLLPPGYDVEFSAIVNAP